MALILKITPNGSSSSLDMSFGKDKEDTPTYSTYTLTLVNISFKKQMYKPCEIHARVQFSGAISYADLTAKFLNQKVSLNRGEKESIASGYYIDEITVEYGDNTYVDFTIVSPDKLLTEETGNKAWTGKRLGEDILLSEKAPTIKMPYDSNTLLSTITSVKLRNQLKYTVSSEDNEYIQPFLVQYDESFYDMLIRTANRWGELVYFENGQFVLGRVDGQDVNMDTYASFSHFKNPPENNTPGKNGSRAVVTDEYLEVIKKSHKPEYDEVRHDSVDQKGNEYIKQAGDMYAHDPVYTHHVLQKLFNMQGNVFDWTFNTFTDDEITAAQNEHILYHLEQKYNDYFFSAPTKTISGSDSTAKNAEGDLVDVVKTKYGTIDSVDAYRQFGTFYNNGGLTETNYSSVREKELTAGKEIFCFEMDDSDANYKHFQLGDLFYILSATDAKDTEKVKSATRYLVIRVEGDVKEEVSVKGNVAQKDILSYDDVRKKTETVTVNSFVSAELIKKKSLRYRVYAVQQSSAGVYYPPMLPTGHIRFSGPQIGQVTDGFDPKLNGRYRVTLFSANTPWLSVSHEMAKKDCGTIWQLEPETYVLLDFKDGNVELPYIVGALQQSEKRSNNRASMFNVMDFTTPAGHSIRLSDGSGGGSANFFASFFPLAGWIKDFHPDLSAMPEYGGYTKYYEGGMDLTDKFGIYSIKASTDKRNISINSPYGTVNLNAFNGITISAPNGDVKIQGKNVSIEAGNNISITSGKNITNGLFGSGLLVGGGRANSLGAVGSDIANTLGKKAADWLDISIIRDALEIFIRPISGVLEIKSSRIIQMQAGVEKDSMRIQNTKGSTVHDWIVKNWKVAPIFRPLGDRFNYTSNKLWETPEFGTIAMKSVTNTTTYMHWYDVFGHEDTAETTNQSDLASKLHAQHKAWWAWKLTRSSDVVNLGVRQAAYQNTQSATNRTRQAIRNYDRHAAALPNNALTKNQPNQAAPMQKDNNTSNMWQRFIAFWKR